MLCVLYGAGSMLLPLVSLMSPKVDSDASTLEFPNASEREQRMYEATIEGLEQHQLRWRTFQWLATTAFLAPEGLMVLGGILVLRSRPDSSTILYWGLIVWIALFTLCAPVFFSMSDELIEALTRPMLDSPGLEPEDAAHGLFERIVQMSSVAIRVMLAAMLLVQLAIAAGFAWYLRPSLRLPGE